MIDVFDLLLILAALLAGVVVYVREPGRKRAVPRRGGDAGDGGETTPGPHGRARGAGRDHDLSDGDVVVGGGE